MSPDDRSEAEREAARAQREAARRAREEHEGARDVAMPPPEDLELAEFVPAAPTPDVAPPEPVEDLAAPPPATLRDWREAAGDPSPDPPLVRRVAAGTPPSAPPPPHDPFETPTPASAPPPRIPAAPGAYTPGRRPPAPPRRRRRPWRVVALVAALLAVVAIGWLAVALFQPFHGDGGAEVVVVVPAGASAREVGDLLAERGVVSSGLLFSLRARLSGKRGDLRAGRFTLRHDMSYGAAIDALTTEPAPPPVVRVTIPEGQSRREIAATATRAGVAGDYLAASARSAHLRPPSYGAPRGTDSLEGFLFPATYELTPRQTARTLVAQQLAAFKDNIATVDMRRARTKNLTTYDLLTIASMIEREAGVARDRRLIAAVIYNRLKAGMALGIDATLRYELNDWTNPLRQSQLQSDSPYNTRTRLGLPPTPIGNPGLASLKAAADPAKVDYLYYVVKPCANGAHAFSSTKAQFDEDVAAYNRERDRLGRSPVTC